VKFKRGQLARDTRNIEPSPCIVLGREAWGHNCDVIYYKVYLIKHQRINYTNEQFLSPINPQVSESEV
jgi:hypothetical protein